MFNIFGLAVLLVVGAGAKAIKEDNSTLELVHVVFRDGLRTPSTFWDSNPYKDASFYRPYGFGQLTNAGKNKEYELGVALRQRYDSFLGSEWNMSIYDAWSTNYNRTKMSLELVLTGLFPPADDIEWNKQLLWQPIPYNYLPVNQDLLLSSYACATVIPLIYGDEANMEKLKSYDDLMLALSNGTGKTIDYLDALDIWMTLRIQEELGYELEEWAQAVYPEPLSSYYVDFYYIETSNVELKKILGGYLLKKILVDSQNKVSDDSQLDEKKIYLYSSHETSIALPLASMQYQLTECPPTGSYLLFEVHNIDGVHGIKIFYQDYHSVDPQIVVVPGCEEFCPLDDFATLIKDILPDSDVECFGESV